MKQNFHPLIAHIFIGARTNGMLVHLVTIFIRRRLTQNEAVLQPVQEHRQGLFGYENDRLVIRHLHFGDVLEIGRLQAAPFLVPHSINGKGHILGSKRRSVVKLDPFFRRNTHRLPWYSHDSARMPT